jgi:hypothetical protein
MNLVHGVELDAEGKPAWLRFGMLGLLYRLYGTQTAEPSVQAWLARLHSDVFRHCVSHFQQCFGKFDRAVGHVARFSDAADGAMSRFGERARQGKEQPFSRSDRRLMDEINMDLPLFLDAMFFYLRIQADTFAELVTFFYPGRDRDQISSDSFRTLRKWFMKKDSTFDSEYTAILLANSEWFDLLSGDSPKGLRDVTVHHKGMLQVGWAKPADGPIEPRIALYRRDGIREENVFAALRKITIGWFAFLDASWLHFVPRLAEAGILATTYVNDLQKTRWEDCRGRELASLWVYPTSADV